MMADTTTTTMSQQETKQPIPSSSSSPPLTPPPWAWIKCLRDMTDPLKNQSHNNIKEVELPVQILPWLFLSDRKNAIMNIPKLRQKNITHILSVHGMSPNEILYYQERLEGTNIIHKQINCDDTEGYDMIGKHWNDTCYEFLKSVRQSPHGKVVVHCVAGINRSGLIVCCAQMIFEQQLLLDVVQHCLNQRGGSLLWNRSFQRQLCDLAQKHQLLGPKPNNYNDEPLIEELPPPPPAHHTIIIDMQSAKRNLQARLNFDAVLAATNKNHHQQQQQQQTQQSSNQQQGI